MNCKYWINILHCGAPVIHVQSMVGTIVIIDALSILFRSFYGINMYNSAGNHIGGIYGFLDQLLNIIFKYVTLDKLKMGQ